jgi:hypothetical protein
VAAYLDLLNGVDAAARVARFRSEDAAAAAPAGDSGEPASDGGAPGRETPADDVPAPPCAGCGYDDCRCGDPSQSDPHDDGNPNNGDPDARTGDEPGDHPWECPPGISPCAGCGYDDCRCDEARDRDPLDDGEGIGGPDIGNANDSGGDDRGGTGGLGTGGGQGPGDGGQSGSSPDPGAAVASEVNLTLRHLDIPFLTAAGLAQRAGEARSLGVLDPALARRLAEAAARHPGSTFCITITNDEGHAIGHGCARPRRRHRIGKSRKKRGPPPAPPPVASGFALIPRDNPGPPGGFGSWLLTLPGRAGDYIIDLHPVPTGECGHQHESPRHDPGDLLRHLITIRDGKCGFPACSRHARESDLEHARPFDKGGRTCGCNCWACSRSCHQLKQSDGWDVTEIRPGYHQWTTPSGRTYVQEPWRYPA